jgi:hypothetical protein
MSCQAWNYYKEATNDRYHSTLLIIREKRAYENLINQWPGQPGGYNN